MEVMEGKDIAQIISQLSSIGFAVWYAWHTTTVTIPQLSKRSNEITKDLADKHDITINKLVEDFRKDLKEERLEFLNQLVAINVTSDRMCDAITDLRQAISTIQQDKES